jgi:hypothetical protein
MTITKLLDIFESYEGEDEALASFRTLGFGENP